MGQTLGASNGQRAEIASDNKDQLRIDRSAFSITTFGGQVKLPCVQTDIIHSTSLVYSYSI